MNRIDKPSIALGIYFITFLWSGTDLVAAGDVRSFAFVVDLVFAVGSVVLTVWTLREIARRTGVTVRAHIDTEGAYAALRCTGCAQHLLWLEHDRDLSRLTAARDKHVCPNAAQTGSESTR